MRGAPAHPLAMRTIPGNEGEREAPRGWKLYRIGVLDGWLVACNILLRRRVRRAASLPDPGDAFRLMTQTRKAERGP